MEIRPKNDSVAHVDPANNGEAWPELLREAERIKLVVVDMDGTFLGSKKDFPAGGGEIIQKLRAAGIMFCPASGRQFQTLENMFRPWREGMPFIAENGGNVMMDGEQIWRKTLPVEVAGAVVDAVRALAADGEDTGVVVCGPTAYAERSDERFYAETLHYYDANAIVDDVKEHIDVAYKLGVLDFGDPTVRLIDAVNEAAAGQAQVVRSGAYWTDVNPLNSHKGIGLAKLQEKLGIAAAETVCFGDFHNDIEMFEHAEFTFAMENGEPEVKEAARFIVPPNTEAGVLQVLRALFAAR